MASKFPRLIVHDLLAHKTEFPLHGRDQDIERLYSILQRQHHHNVVLSGKHGVGKTALLHQFMKNAPLLAVPYLKLDTQQISSLLHHASSKEAVVQYLQEAFATLPSCVVILDDAEKVLNELSSAWEVEEIVKAFTTGSKARLILSVVGEQQELLTSLHSTFETMTLSEITSDTCRTIIFEQAARFSAIYHLQMTREAVGSVVEYAQQYSSAYAQPEHTLRFFEETCAAVASRHNKILEQTDVRAVFSRRVGLPVVETKTQQQLQQLSLRLKKRVHGQQYAVQAVSKTIQTGWLGLKDPTKPMGSFLFLGPSGVGKTELAKAISSEAYGDEKAVLRLDMSEFAEAHTAQRLLGAPPGYVGYEAGGQLTDFVRQKPFSLILLDEIEKAHPSLFDIFLQVLDDGRLTDGQGRTVDFTKTIIIATSNIGSLHIVKEASQGADVTLPSWRERHILPLLLNRFRPEFLNRFSDIIIFKPFSKEDLIAIAKLEIKKFEERFKDRQLKIQVSEEWLEQAVSTVSNPLFGARPLKRLIESACEEMMMKEFLKKTPV